MAERKKATTRAKAERQAMQESLEQKQQKTKQYEREQKTVSELDKPNQPEQPDHIRHAVYFFTVVVGALVLNLIVLLIVSGGR